MILYTSKNAEKRVLVFTCKDRCRYSGKRAKFCQNLARYRLYRHRSLQVNTCKYAFCLAAFFKIYQIIQLNFLKLKHFKFGKILQFLRHLQNFAEFSQKLLFFQSDFCEKIKIAAVQKDVNLVELEKCCQTHIFLQNCVLIQPRASPPKIYYQYTILQKQFYFCHLC